MDFKSKNVAELRQELVEKYNYTEEQVSNITGKTNLVNELLKNMMNNVSLADENLSPLEDPTVFDMDVESPFDNLPLDLLSEEINDQHPKWTEYVLSHLHPNEKSDGYPTMQGLRRLVEYFVGPIVETRSNVVMAPSDMNGNHATVVTTVVVEKKNGTFTVVEGCANANDLNVDKKYKKFPVSMAQSRAEARAYTRVLNLHTVSADEVVNEGEIEDQDLITEKQIKTIENICNRANIKLEKVLEKHGLANTLLKDIKDSKARELLALLISYEQTGVPEELK